MTDGGRGFALGSPLNGYGKLPGAWDGLDDDVALLDATGLQLVERALDEWLDDSDVPPGMDDANAQAAAVVLLRGWTFERRHGGRRWLRLR